jgi:hypothetical protein
MLELRLVDAGFRQQERTLAFGFLVENVAPEADVEDTQYRVTALGPGQAVVGRATGRVPAVSAGERLGVAGAFEVAAGANASRITVDLTPGRRGAAVRTPLRTEGVAWRNSGGPRVVGVVVNPSEHPSGWLALSALALNADGRIVGAGATTAGPVPPNGRAAVEVPILAGTTLAEVELYATSE